MLSSSLGRRISTLYTRRLSIQRRKNAKIISKMLGFRRQEPTEFLQRLERNRILTKSRRSPIASANLNLHAPHSGVRVGEMSVRCLRSSGIRTESRDKETLQINPRTPTPRRKRATNKRASVAHVRNGQISNHACVCLST